MVVECMRKRLTSSPFARIFFQPSRSTSQIEWPLHNYISQGNNKFFRRIFSFLFVFAFCLFFCFVFLFFLILCHCCFSLPILSKNLRSSRKPFSLDIIKRSNRMPTTPPIRICKISEDKSTPLSHQREAPVRQKHRAKAA